MDGTPLEFVILRESITMYLRPTFPQQTIGVRF